MRSEGPKIESEGRESVGWVLGEGQQAIMLFTAAGDLRECCELRPPNSFPLFSTDEGLPDNNVVNCG